MSEGLKKKVIYREREVRYINRHFERICFASDYVHTKCCALRWNWASYGSMTILTTSSAPIKGSSRPQATSKQWATSWQGREGTLGTLFMRWEPGRYEVDRIFYHFAKKEQAKRMLGRCFFLRVCSSVRSRYRRLRIALSLLLVTSSKHCY